LLNEGIAIPPALGRTWFIALLRATFRRFKDGKECPSEAESSGGSESDDGKGSEITPRGENHVPLSGKQAGGRRRKAVRK